MNMYNTTLSNNTHIATQHYTQTYTQHNPPQKLQQLRLWGGEGLARALCDRLHIVWVCETQAVDSASTYAWEEEG